MSLVAASDGPRWTDVLTAVGTVALAGVALLTIIITLFLSRHERTDADRRLREERDAADQRLRDERAFAERTRQEDRRVYAASMLLSVVAEVQRVAERLVGVNAGLPLYAFGMGQPDEGYADAQAVLIALQTAAHTEAVALGGSVEAQRFLTLVQLAQAAARYDGGMSQTRPRWVGDLRNYCVFVRLSLRGLIDGSPVGEPGTPEYPDLWREYDRALWAPTQVPPGWHEALQTDPEHPQYRPIPRPSAIRAT